MSEDVIQTRGERRDWGIADAQITETVPEYRILRFIATLSQIINLVHFMLVLHPTKLQNFQKMLNVGFGALLFLLLFVCVCVCAVEKVPSLPFFFFKAETKI